MILYYLKIVFRNLLRNQLFFAINVGGLALGLACCVFIIWFVHDELTFDRFNEKADRIYRITTTFIDPPNTNRIRFTDQKIGPLLKRVNPGVEEVVRMGEFNGKFSLGNELIDEPNIFATDPSIFDVFTYPLLAGNPKNVFEKKNSIVLSETLAKKYFDSDALGKSISIDKQAYEVTGIMKDVPANADLWVNGLVYGDFPGEEANEVQLRFDTYVLFKSPVNITELQTELNKAAAAIWHQEENELGIKYEVQPLTELHFTQGIQMDHAKGNKNNIYIFLIVAVILLLVVIFNYINLTTVQSLERAKEVGVRKVIGATPEQLMRQFIGESFLITIFSGIIALLIVRGLYPVFHLVTGKVIHFASNSDLIIIAAAILVLILVAAFSSLYPAWILSSFKPAAVLKGSFAHQPKGNFVRKIFITGQFGLCTSLLVFLLVVITQITLMRKSDLGFNQDQVLIIEIPRQGISGQDLNFIKNELLKSKGVSHISSGTGQSLPGGTTGSIPVWFSQSGTEHEIQAQRIEADVDYPDLLQLQLVEGKTIKHFPESQWNDLALINETLAKQIGSDDPVGKQIEIFSFEGRKKIRIAGVIRDFHFKSLHNTIEPLVFSTVPQGEKYFFIRLLPEHLEDLKATWRKLLPDHPIQYFFLNESFDKQYHAEKNLMTLLFVFSCITICLAGFGLYGLTAYTVELRTKEIGIRKVLGARVISIISLLSIDFIKLVLIGSIAGSIVAAYASKKWLTMYAYKIELQWWLFILPLITIIILSIAVIIYRTYSTAQTNPVNSLKYE